MTARTPRSAVRTGTARRRWAPTHLVVLACAAFLGPASAAAGDWAGRATVGAVDQDDSRSGSNSAYRQSAQLVFNHGISDQLGYSATLDYLEDIGATHVGEASTRSHDRTLRPTASLRWRLDDVMTGGRYEYTYTTTLDPALDAFVARQLQTGDVFGTYKPSETFMAGLSGDRYLSHDDATGLGTTNDRFTSVLEWRPRRFRIYEENRVLRFSDDANHASRLSYGPRTELQYDDAFAKRIFVSTRYTIDYLRSQDSTLAAGAGTVEVEQRPSLAISGRNDIPTDTSSSPLAQNPTLIDGDYNASTGISLGPDGASFWNMGLDMGRVVDGDQFRVHVRNRDGGVVQGGGIVTFTVYTSTDGVRWVAIPVGTQAFDAAGSFYRIDFARQSARFFKVVNFGTNTLDTYVTELQLSSAEQAAGNRTRTSSAFLQTLQGTVSAKVLDQLTLGYSGLFNFQRVSAEAAPTQDLHDGTQAFTATAGPFGPITATATHLRRDARLSSRGRESTRSWSGVVQYAPIPRYTAFLTVQTSTDTLDATEVTVHSAGVENHLQLWDAIRLTAAVKASRQLLDGGRTDFLGGSGALETDVTREITLFTRADLQRAVSGDAASTLAATDAVPIARIIQYGTYSQEVRYVASVRFTAAARVGYVDAPMGSGMLQDYTLVWSPFADGAIQLNTSFEQNVDVLSGRRFRRATLMPRWLLNRHTTLDLNYNYVFGTDQAGARRQQTVFLTLSLTS